MISSARLTTTVSQRLADHIVTLDLADVPPAVVGKAKDLIIHTLGLALRARGAESGETAMRVDRALNVVDELSAVEGASSVIGDRRKVDLLDAVFANCCLLGSTALHDFLLPGGHPGIATQPVAWVVGEATHASGREFLTAVVAGYDVYGKLAKTVRSLNRTRRTNNVFGPFGAAATAARLYGLSSEETQDALGHASHAGMGILEGLEFQWPTDALLARNGTMAALLAKAGINAGEPVVSTIEGRHGVFQTFFNDVPSALEDSLATLGHEFEISSVGTKRYETSALSIIPIELMLGLTKTHHLTPEDVATLDVFLPVEREEVEMRRDAFLASPGTPRAARTRSLRLQLAAVVSDGSINPARFDEHPGAALQAMLSKIRMRFEAERPVRYARVEVTTADGERYLAEGDAHDFPPLDWAQWLSESGQSILSSTQLARLIDLIENLEDVSDVAEVVRCLVPNGDT